MDKEKNSNFWFILPLKATSNFCLMPNKEKGNEAEAQKASKKSLELIHKSQELNLSNTNKKNNGHYDDE